ncbi:hypothetical protein lbkm_1715 [Lachnospiraceae bacterium KM106-2]|nr:hypothetical protein lbkm_1715 [Lachnospiraceae bacterium KM106-2]
MIEYLNKLNLPADVEKVLRNSNLVVFPKTREELIRDSFGHDQIDCYEVDYEVPNKGRIVEATVTRCKNGVVVNFPEDYMRRRDPDCMVIGDEKPTDKRTYKAAFGKKFDSVRKETFAWLQNQELLVLPFMSGGKEYGYESLLIAPKNAAFFACGLADMQGFLNIDEIEDGFTPKAIVYLAPPFRHTHYDGKQIVVHNRKDEMHEVFSYNLYPGPSAKKGIYAVLLDIGEQEGWITCHASAVKVITPYDNEIVIMHEGASGGGKSEMLEPIHREMDRRIVMAQNTVTGEKTYIDLQETSELRPVTDDMAICHTQMQNDSKKLVVMDAEAGWFLRIDHIKEYGSAPQLEKNIISPKEPLVFFNVDGAKNATCLPWEHTLDSNHKPCPNPRVILPREMMDGIVSEPVEVDVRSFGVRTPPSTKENPGYGIMGMFHILPPALAWLWRLVAPRGYNNPSIVSTKGMSSEGVGSYWPFATGKKVVQANLLLEQIMNSPSTRYVLIPNQHIGAYEVGFMPQWVAREYIARRGGAKFKPGHLVESRCTLLGYGLDTLKIDGQYIRKAFLQPEMQSELGEEGYDAGAAMLTDFFKKELEQYNTEELHPVGRKIIECFMNEGSLEQYIDIIPMRF